MPGIPGPVKDEREGLLAFLEQQRAGIRNAVHGLTLDQATVRPTVGDLSLGGLLKHAAIGERHWMDIVTQRPAAEPIDWADQHRLLDGETVEGWLEAWAAIARDTEEIIAGLDLSDPVPVPQGVPWFPRDVEAWSVRWVLLHLIEEFARHAGHADILRETIDGKTMYVLVAEVEQWETVPW